MKRFFVQDYKPLKFDFYQNKDDFKVYEEPIEFTNRGNFVVLKIEKVGLGTWDLIDTVARNLNIYDSEIGYAGLKDKNATTVQYITIPRKYIKDLKKFRHSKVKILDTTFHSTKLNIGDLAGNSFEINLHNVEQNDVGIIEKRIREISKVGMPNFFGYQRFGRDFENNLEKANKIIYGDLKIKDRKLEKMLISQYQSDLFNKWLAQRVKISKDSFKLLSGDVFYSYEQKKYFTPSKINEKVLEDFSSKKITPTGLLCGREVYRAKYDAREIEKDFDDTYIQEKGLRREAIVFPENIEVNYNKESKKCALKFRLPKASYATVLVENIANRNLRV